MICNRMSPSERVSWSGSMTGWMILALTAARLQLAGATRHALRVTLGLLGLSAPEKM